MNGMEAVLKSCRVSTHHQHREVEEHKRKMAATHTVWALSS
jgi:hypothetical protein